MTQRWLVLSGTRSSPVFLHVCFSGDFCSFTQCFSGSDSRLVTTGATICGLDPASVGNERSIAAERRSCRTSETTPGSPQECWSDLVGTNEPSRGCCDSVKGVSYLGWTVPTWTSTRSHPSSGSPIWRGSHCNGVGFQTCGLGQC